MSSVLSPHSARLTESHGGDACASSDAQKTSSEWSLASKTPAKIGSELFFGVCAAPRADCVDPGPWRVLLLGRKRRSLRRSSGDCGFLGLTKDWGVLHIHQARPGSA